MADVTGILQSIKKSIHDIEPRATLILFGSCARGDYKEHSDIDLLILLDKKERITFDERCKITAPIQDMELKTGMTISSILCTNTEWENHMVTPFYENVKREGGVV